MIQFDKPLYLFLLLLIPAVIILYYRYLKWREKAAANFAGNKYTLKVLPWSNSSNKLKFILLLLAVLFIIIALVNPKTGNKKEKVKVEGVDVIIAADLSNSMLATDIAPNRLEREKQLIGKLVEKLSGNRIGLIIFAGSAYLQVPLTSDHEAVKLFLGSLDPSMIKTQGTSISDAIDLADRSFGEKETKFKTLIILSDGEVHEQEAIGAAENAADKGMKIHTIGLGTTGGSNIPIQTEFGEDIKRDEQGNEVISKLNPAMLKEVAEAGKGKYFSTSKTNIVNELADEISKMDKKQMQEVRFSGYKDRFQLFLALALLCIVIEFFISERAFTNPFKKKTKG